MLGRIHPPLSPTTMPLHAVLHLAPQLYVATGGNGFAAKSSDEIGRMGAECALHGYVAAPNELAEASPTRWCGDNELPASLFEPRLRIG